MTPEFGFHNFGIDEIGGRGDNTGMLREGVPKVHEHEHPEPTVGDPVLVLFEHAALSLFDAREHRSKNDGSPVDGDLTVDAQNIPEMFLGDFIPRTCLPDNGTEESVNEELYGEFEELFLGRASRKTLSVAKIFQNILGSNPRCRLGAIGEMEGFLDKVTRDGDFIAEDCGSDGDGVGLFVEVEVAFDQIIQGVQLYDGIS